MTNNTTEVFEPTAGSADIAGRMLNAGVYSSNKQDWETPPEFVRLIEHKYGFRFDLDSCCYPRTAKARRFFTEEDDGLAQDWTKEDGSAAFVWMNPPYGNALPVWTKKAKKEAQEHGSTVFCLVPGRTDTKWFHDAARFGKLILMKGRLSFLQDGEQQGSPAFPSVLIIFGPGQHGVEYWDWKPEMAEMLAEENMLF